jgi:hypothetical protein
MTPQIVTEYTKKHGTQFLLICAIFWLNNRLSNVETKLYDCLEDSAQMKAQPIHTNKQYKKEHIYAILPKETKYNGKSKRQMEG